MALALEYPDAYLARFCTDDREARAFSDVDEVAGDAPFPAPWRDRLARLRCYVLACMENQAAPDDLFTAKLKSYRAEYDATLAQAQDAIANTDQALVFVLPVERG